MNLKSMTQPEIGAVLKELGQPAFRAKQVYTWLHKGVRSYEEMTNLPKGLRDALSENDEFYLEPLSLPAPFPKNESGMLTLVPGEYDTDGFFISRLRRKL